MAKIKLEQLDNSGKPTGHTGEYDEEAARRMMSGNRPKWREVSGKEKVKPESK